MAVIIYFYFLITFILYFYFISCVLEALYIFQSRLNIYIYIFGNKHLEIKLAKD